jgi:hypothetical protein
MTLNYARLSIILIALLMTAMRCAQAQEAPVMRDMKDPNPYATRVVDPEVEAYFKQKALDDKKVSKCCRVRDDQMPESS